MANLNKIRNEISKIEAQPFSIRLEAKHRQLCDKLWDLQKAKRRKAKVLHVNKADDRLRVDVDRAIGMLMG
jgi:hypothetical protein